MNPTLKLHLAINAIVPIIGVSVGDSNDKTTWTVTYVQEPAEERKAQVQVIIDSSDFNATERAVDCAVAVVAS